MFVPKKSGELRLCVEYQELNKKTSKDAYPLPLLDEIVLLGLQLSPHYIYIAVTDSFQCFQKIVRRQHFLQGQEWDCSAECHLV